MNSDYLVKMANEIAAFYDGCDADAPARVAEHIRRYWERRMVDAFVAHLRAGGAGLAPTSLAAASRLAN